MKRSSNMQSDTLRRISRGSNIIYEVVKDSQTLYDNVM